jgi:hypothetical protein
MTERSINMKIYYLLIAFLLSSYLVAEDYILISPLANNDVYLVDRSGDTVYEWNTNYGPGLSVYLLPDGTLLRCEGERSEFFRAGGAGGRIALYDKDSNLLWDYEVSDSTKLSHHDIEVMPNGHILIIAWEKKSKEEALSNGLNPNMFSDDEIWSDYIFELDPDTKDIVWEWHVWDHLIQDFDSSKSNYGVVSESPDKVNINYFGSKDKVDWIHLNSVDYNGETDQILLSSHSFSELWIVNHGENSGIVHRWGNPEAMGQSGDRVLYAQHDGIFLDNGNILVFNNGDRKLQPYSEVIELTNLSTDPEIVWSYSDKENFYAMNISGASRLENGNTLICNGPSGEVFEVTPESEIVWSYTNEYYSNTPKSTINEIFRAESYSDDFSGIKVLFE